MTTHEGPLNSHETAPDPKLKAAYDAVVAVLPDGAGILEEGVTGPIYTRLPLSGSEVRWRLSIANRNRPNPTGAADELGITDEHEVKVYRAPTSPEWDAPETVGMEITQPVIEATKLESTGGVQAKIFNEKREAPDYTEFQIERTGEGDDAQYQGTAYLGGHHLDPEEAPEGPYRHHESNLLEQEVMGPQQIEPAAVAKDVGGVSVNKDFVEYKRGLEEVVPLGPSRAAAMEQVVRTFLQD